MQSSPYPNQLSLVHRCLATQVLVGCGLLDLMGSSQDLGVSQRRVVVRCLIEASLDYSQAPEAYEQACRNARSWLPPYYFRGGIEPTYHHPHSNLEHTF